MALAGTISGAKASTVPAALSTVSIDKVAAVNAATVKSIESSWLLVPGPCKAAGFNALPSKVPSTQARIEIQNLYNSLMG